MSAADEDITSCETSIIASRIISMINLVTLTNPLEFYSLHTYKLSCDAPNIVLGLTPQCLSIRLVTWLHQSGSLVKSPHLFSHFQYTQGS